MSQDKDVRLTNAAMRAYAEATGRDATVPFEEKLENMKRVIDEALSEDLPAQQG
jgi:hypothetical protein